MSGLPLGMELRVSIQGRDARFSGSTVTGGPMRDGQTVAVAVRLGPERARWTGYFVDEDNQAIVNASLTARQVPEHLLDREDMSMLPARGVRTDERGRFVLPQHIPSTSSKRVWLLLTKKEDQFDRAAKLLLPANPSGVVDLGTLMLRATGTVRFVARGRVIDQDGRPISHRVSVSAYSGAKEKRVAISRAPIKVGRGGIFEIYSARDEIPETFEVWANARGFVGDHKIVKNGAADIVLQLTPGGKLEGSCRMPEGPPTDRIVATLHRQGTPNTSRNGIYSGKFGRDGLRAGRYDLAIKIKDTPWILARVEAIDVAAGAAAGDPRLHDIDLRGTFRLLRVRLTRPNGRPLGLSNMTVRTPDGSRGSFSVDGDSRMTIVAPPQYDTFTLENNIGIVTVAWAQGEQVAQLRAPPKDK